MILKVVFERIGLLIIAGGMLKHDCIDDHDLYDEWLPDAVICIIAMSLHLDLKCLVISCLVWSPKVPFTLYGVSIYM